MKIATKKYYRTLILKFYCLFCNFNTVFLLLLIFILSLMPAKAQKQKTGKIQQFMNMHWPEQLWAITHPFVVKKAWNITKEARQMATQMQSDTTLDEDDNGGQIDAFRHAYWMARLTQAINAKKAWTLGIAHEKGNYLDFKHKKTEEGTVPDSISREMDFRNNRFGIQLGANHPKASKQELAEMIKKAILSGKLWIIKKDNQGNYLNWKDEVLEPEQYQNKWNNPKCIVRSDYQKNN